MSLQRNIQTITGKIANFNWLNVFYILFLGNIFMNLIRIFRYEIRVESAGLWDFILTDYVRILVFVLLVKAILFYYLLKQKRLAYLILFGFLVFSFIFRLFFKQHYFFSFYLILEIMLLALSRKNFSSLVRFKFKMTEVLVWISSGLIFLAITLVDLESISQTFKNSATIWIILVNYIYALIAPEETIYYSDFLSNPVILSKFWADLAIFGGLIWLGFGLQNYLENRRNQSTAVVTSQSHNTLESSLIEKIQKLDSDQLFLFKINPNNKIYTSDLGHIFYTANQDTRIVLGDPIFEVNLTMAHQINFLKSFKDAANQAGYLTCFFQCSQKFEAVFKLSGYISLKIGEEAIVDLSNFKIQDSTHKNLRNNLNRAKRENLQFELIPFADLRPEQIQIFENLKSQWLAHKKPLKTGFTTGSWPMTSHIPGFLALAKDDTDYLAACTFLPFDFDQKSLVLDYLVRGQKAKSFAMDALLTFVILQFQNQNYRQLSLGMAPAEQESKNRLLLSILKILPDYSFEGLRGFKDKFKPVWQTKFIYLESKQTLPFIVRGIAEMFVGPESRLIQIISLFIAILIGIIILFLGVALYFALNL